jgi:hypothetical protein
LRACRSVCTLAGSYGGRSTHRDDISPLLHRQSGGIYEGWRSCSWRRREHAVDVGKTKPKLAADCRRRGSHAAKNPSTSPIGSHPTFLSLLSTIVISIYLFVFRPQVRTFMTNLLVVVCSYVMCLRGLHHYLFVLSAASQYACQVSSQPAVGPF